MISRYKIQHFFARKKRKSNYNSIIQDQTDKILDNCKT